MRINRELLDRYLALARGLVATGRAAPPTVDGLLGLPRRGARSAEAERDARARAAVGGGDGRQPRRGAGRR